MMKRRGYILSAIVLAIDCALFLFGGGFVALVAVGLSCGIGEWAARRKCGAFPCVQEMGVRQQKLVTCYQRVEERIERNGICPPKKVRLFIIPGEEMNAYCFGARSIGVTEGMLNLDDKMIESVLAHELGHLMSGDSILNMVLMANCMGILVMVALCNAVLLIAVALILLIFFAVSSSASFLAYFLAGKTLHGMKRLGQIVKVIVLKVCQMVIAGFGRRSEFRADNFSASLGYAFYLRTFLSRFAADLPASGRGMFDVLYDTHPSTAARIARLSETSSGSGLPVGR